MFNPILIFSQPVTTAMPLTIHRSKYHQTNLPVNTARATYEKKNVFKLHIRIYMN